MDSAALSVWRVVGGKTTGGILVRQGKTLQSMPCDRRLETGALVEEHEREGDRLNYRKLSGFGPQTGWVSISLKGKELLVLERVMVHAFLDLDKGDGARSGNNFDQALFGNDGADKTAIDPAPHAAGPVPCLGAVAPVHTADAAYDVAHVPRSQLQCATASCRFRVHTRKELGGYCCISCSEGGDHGPRCEQKTAPIGAQRADANWLPMEGGQLEEVEFDEAIRLSTLEVTTRRSCNEVEDSEFQQAVQLSILDIADADAEVTTRRSCNEVEDSEFQRAVQLSIMDIADADADLAEAIRLSMVDTAETINLSTLDPVGTPAAEMIGSCKKWEHGHRACGLGVQSLRSLHKRYRADAKYRDQVQYVVRQLQMCIASELKLSAIFKGPVSEVLQGFYEADLMKDIENERLSCVETLNVLRTFVVDAEEVQRQLEGLRKAEEEYLEPSTRDKENLPPDIAALVSRLGENNRSLVREIKYAAGSTLKFQYMQKCLLLAEGADSQFQGKEQLRELWLALTNDDRKDIERAFHLADGQRDAFFMSIVEEDRHYRHKLDKENQSPTGAGRRPTTARPL